MDIGGKNLIINVLKISHKSSTYTLNIAKFIKVTNRTCRFQDQTARNLR